MNASDDLFNFEDWKGIDVPPRSELFRPEPQGLGTLHQESLLSYLIRVSHAHAVNPRVLVKYVLAEHNHDIRRIATKAFFQTLSGTVNGLCFYAETFANALSAVTCRPDLQQLTFLPWKELFPHNGQGLIARRPRWCPSCLQESRKQVQGTPTPLVWALEPYHVCLAHRVLLENRCHVCGTQQDFLPSYPDPGYCRRCRSWLGHEVNPQDISDFHLWVAKAVVDMITCGSHPSVEPSADTFRRFLGEEINRHAAGNRTAFCRAAGLGDYAVSGWLNKQQRPSVGQFLTVCHALQALPSEIFHNPRPIETFPPIAAPVKLTGRKRCPRPTFLQRSVLKHRLKAELISDGSNSTINMAKALGVSSGCLRYWFPDLCKALSNRSRKMRQEQSALRKARQIAMLQEIVAAARRNGNLMSRRTVDKEMREHGLTISQPHLRKSLQEVQTDGS